MQGAITTYKDDSSIVDEIVQESVSPSRWRCRKKLWWVCLRARDHRIRRGKSSFEGWGKLTLLLIDQFPCWWLEKDVSCPREKLLAGSVVRGRIDFSYLPVVGTRTICLFEGLCISATWLFVTSPRSAKNILWRCVDICNHLTRKTKSVCGEPQGRNHWNVYRRAPSQVSFKESYRITSCLC